MKRFCGFYMLAVALLLSVLPVSVCAQSLKTFNRDVCYGASLFLDGGLYEILTNDCEILSIKAEGIGEELKDKERVELTVSTDFHIQYKDNANLGGTLAHARVTVMKQPELKVEVTDPKPMPGILCKGTQVTLKAISGTSGVFWTISTSPDYSQQATTVTFTMNENCWVTAQSYNSCGVVDTSIYFPVISDPDLSKARLELNTNLGNVCIGCGFFPKPDDIIKRVTQGTLISQNLTWEEGTTAEETIEAGAFSKKIRVQAVVEQQSAGCGASSSVSRTIDSVITLHLAGKDCKPTMQSSVSLKPCRTGEVQLKDMNADCSVSSPTLTPNPGMKVSATPASSDRFPYEEERNGQTNYTYFWDIRWDDYKPTDPPQSLQAQASYTIACRYSTAKPSITENFSQTVSVQIDTVYIDFDYKYCPDGKAKLEIKGQKGIVTIKSVELVRPTTETLSSMFSGPVKEAHQWTFESVVPITVSSYEKYQLPRLKVAFDVKDGSCDFSSVQEEDVPLKQRTDCGMRFEMSQTGPCIGETRTFRLSNADGAVADRITVEPHPEFVFDQNPSQLSFKPYYAGAPTVASMPEKPYKPDDSITATIYYHLNGSSQTFSITKKFWLEVKACPPRFNGVITINEDNCPLCPGMLLDARVEFENNTTLDTSLTRVNFIGTAPDEVESKERWRSLSAEKPFYQLRRYLFADMEYEVDVVYNEGDSLYRISQLLLDNRESPVSTVTLGFVAGESVSNTSIKMARLCELVKEASFDSVCAGEEVYFSVYSQNFYDTLISIKWASEEVLPVGQGLEERWEYVNTDDNGTEIRRNIKRFYYKTAVHAPGIYPFEVTSKIRDSIIVRYDTFRIAVLDKPHIFIQDTVYACLNDPVDLWKYVDSSAVEVSTIMTPGAGLIIPNATDDYRVALATLRYHCATTPSITDRIDIKVDPSVYNAFIEDTAHCPGDLVELKAKTNGRVTWTKRRLLPGGGLSKADTLFENIENQSVFDGMGQEDCLYTAIAKTGCERPPFMSVQFWSRAKEEPAVTIIDRSACRPEPLFLQTKPLDATQVGDSVGNVWWYVNGTEYKEASVPPTDSVQVICRVRGLSGCYKSDTMPLYSYQAPQIKIGVDNEPDLTGHVYCAENGGEVRFTAQGAVLYEWSLRSSGTNVSSATEYTLHILQDDTLYLSGKETQHNCVSKDSVFVYLKPLAQVTNDTIGCNGDTLCLRPVEEQGVAYTWYKPDGSELCSCKAITFAPYESFDTGVYKVKFIRKDCDVTKDVHLRMYPVPEFHFTDSVFCEDDKLSLDVLSTGLPETLQSESRFVWYDKERNLLQDYIGVGLYEGRELKLSDAGFYYLEIFVNRCRNIDSVEVFVDAHSHPAFAVDSFYCEGATLSTQAVDQGEGAIYRWYSKNRLPSEGGSNKIELEGLTIEDSTWLTLEIERGACTDDTSVFVHVRSLPVAKIVAQGSNSDGNSVYYCEGMPISLFVEGMRSEDAMSWYHQRVLQEGFSSNRYIIKNSELADSGWYSFHVNRNGCTGKDSLYVDVRVVPVPLVSDTFMCSGTTLVVDASNPLFPGSSFTWQPSGETGAQIAITNGGTYTVRMHYKGCDGNTRFRVDERPSPQIAFPDEATICQRDSIILTGPDGMETYLWQDGSSQQTYVVTREGLYTLYVALAGCSDYSEVMVHEDFCSNLYFPSAFTPNGDGHNDRFGPITTAEDDQVVYSLYIYNRNGEKVFESHSLKDSWDGTFKGEKCPAGIYVYQCKAHAKQNGRNLSEKGTLNLLR